MDATDYWLFAHECSIWNAVVAALQFLTADLDPQSAMPFRGCTQPSSTVILPSTYDTKKKYYSVAL